MLKVMMRLIVQMKLVSQKELMVFFKFNFLIN